MAPTKKGRPPNLTLEMSSAKKPGASNTIIELETPIESADVYDEDESLQLSPSSASSSPIGCPSNLETDSDANSDDFSKDLAALERLRRSVHKNLRLRPLRSSPSSSIRAQQPSPPSYRSWSDLPEHHSPSPTSSISPASVYFTPVTELRATPLSAFYVDAHDWKVTSFDAARRQQPARGLDPAILVARLSAPTRPLLIDTRPIGSFLGNRLERSINMAIPSLILKRCRKPNGGFHGLDALRQFITTDDGKHIWDDILTSGDWDGDVIVYDESMDEKNRDNSQAIAWALLPVLESLLDHGNADYLEGGILAAQQHPYLQQLIVTDDRIDDSSQDSLSAPSKKAGGLFQLDVISTSRSKNLPQVEQPPVSPSPMMPSAMHSWHTISDYATPSPPPSQTVFSRPPPPRRPSVPTLGRIDTTSAERLNTSLPKLQVRTLPTKSATLAAPPMHSLDTSSLRSRSRSPSHLNLAFSNRSPPGSARLLSPSTISSSELLPPPSPCFTRSSTPHTPLTPMPRSPSTARPDSSQPPTTEDPFPVFTVSTILPNFLFLGPELTAEEHVEELMSLGVKRILNIAAECDDDHDLHLRERFERYVRIPMRDTVEEDNITRGVREVCELLDDARLHSAPTYVHCKAGKSRSVTAVMAYLIHANHWTLSRAYAFVLERRKGISPNIGFVSELMTFEEQELGGKSVGVVKPPSSAEPDGEESSNGSGTAANYQVALGGRRPQHIRESLPPVYTSSYSSPLVPSVGDTASLGDSGQEMEIKDSSGRYRHARRAPVDEATLQPMRRVSKAGLESSAYV
ncbi:hypothetical protein AcW1_002155 [Taiwanofungus camphoratus]|nr:hypothetical protein AcV5_010146 [Antrodia cinnamomea]KAI0944444.1 hypothetical protein AcW1_002155 [Antrodia cinnamomea]KAI0946102.1 hypothetical protein AcV7_010166 [Antrodia cinnamomea]